MAGDTTIRAIIKLLVEGGHIPKEVSESIKGVGDTSKKTKAELSSLGQAGKELGGLLTQYLGAAALGAFIKSSVTDFANLDRQISTLGEVIRRFGGTSEDLGRVKETLHGLALNGGALLTETIPAMQKFVGITNGNIPAALAAVKLASDAAESGQIQFGEAISGVAAIIQGRARLAANLFGVSLRDNNGHVKTANELLEESIKKFSGVSAGLDDTREKLDKTNAAWEDFKQTVGKGFSALADIGAPAMTAFMHFWQDVGALAGGVFNEVMDFARNIGPILSSAFDLKKLISDPAAYGAALNEAAKRLYSDLAISNQVFQDQIAEDHKKRDAKSVDSAKGTADLITQAKLAAAEEEAKAADEAAKKRLDLEHKTAQDVLQAQIAGAKEGSQERLDLEMRLLDDQEQAAVEAAGRAGVNVNKIHEAFQLQRQAKDQEFAKARAAADLDAETARMRAQEIGRAHV